MNRTDKINRTNKINRKGKFTNSILKKIISRKRNVSAIR